MAFLVCTLAWFALIRLCNHLAKDGANRTLGAETVLFLFYYALFFLSQAVVALALAIPYTLGGIIALSSWETLLFSILTLYWSLRSLWPLWSRFGPSDDNGGGGDGDDEPDPPWDWDGFDRARRIWSRSRPRIRG
jgi:hypothetical protein